MLLVTYNHCSIAAASAPRLGDYCCKAEYKNLGFMVQLFNPLATETKLCMVTFSNRAQTFILEQNVLKSQ